MASLTFNGYSLEVHFIYRITIRVTGRRAFSPLLVDLLVMRGVIQAIDGVMPATHWRVSLQAILER
jgi:hypothetical protein